MNEEDGVLEVCVRLASTGNNRTLQEPVGVNITLQDDTAFVRYYLTSLMIGFNSI